jgi:hypothetical protein
MMKTIALNFRVPSSTSSGGGSRGAENISEEVEALKSCLLQRDNEIAILVNMVSYLYFKSSKISNIRLNIGEERENG